MKILSPEHKQKSTGLRNYMQLLVLLMFILSGSITAQTTVTKHLYLSDPSQSLDRIDPVATLDNTTSSTGRLQAVADGIVPVSTTTAQSNSTSSLSFSHTVYSGDNRLLMVGISTGASY
ncbi:MAG: hypothetical protein PHZ12_06915, partial [Paludibacter sp.]|nr:hypothetical protein [Paludibacter sp.]